MGQDLVEIRPHELRFNFEVKKESSCVVQLINNYKEYVAFKVKTTAPRSYHVKPITGVILLRKTCELTVSMQGLLQAPQGMQLRDKFLVQTTVVPHGTSVTQLVPAFFCKENGRYTKETKLGVVLVSVHQPLEEQPTNGTHDTEPDVQNIGNEVPDDANEVPAPLNINHCLQPKSYIKHPTCVGMYQVTEDVQHLKSKLNNFETKLVETEKMMIRLQRGMGFLLFFMVFMALLCISIGYLLRR